MHLNLKLNARFQPKHRFVLEDALTEVLEKQQLGEAPPRIRTERLHTVI